MDHNNNAQRIPSATESKVESKMKLLGHSSFWILLLEKTAGARVSIEND